MQQLSRKCWLYDVPGIALQHFDDGHSGRKNFCGAVVHSILLIYAPDGNSVTSSRGGEF